MTRGQFYSSAQLESLACDLLVRYQRKAGQSLSPPISAERVLDFALDDDLRPLLWDVIPEPPGRTILAGLAPGQRQIILNESRQQLILGTPGLFNTLIAHEIAHWILHVDHALLDQACLFDMPSTLSIVCEHGSSESWDEKNAHRFMAYLLMPRELIAPRAAATDLLHWREVYALRKEFDVTVTALVIRLEELGFAYVDGAGNFFPSREEAMGQNRLL